MRSRIMTVLTVAVALTGCATAPGNATGDLARGRYLVVIGHCNNCHTEGYTNAAGEIPERDWLLGSKVGWRSSAGTAYPHNLRLYVANLSEDGWLAAARNMRPKPPMPWWSLRDTSDEDLRLIYRFVRSLGPVGDPAPEALPPDRDPPGRHFRLPGVR